MVEAVKLPLSGVRVLDLGIITAGAATTALLADLGAEVIKVESPTYIDPFRVWTGKERKGEWWNQSAYFAFTNRNKKSICLDLKSKAGHALFLRLVKVSDILVENFRRGVLERLNLGIPSLLALNPGLIAAAVSSQGETGADRMAVSFGSTLEATSGMADLTGFTDGPPVLSGRDMNYPDQVVALFAASMILSALLARRNGGTGAHLDVSQRELTAYLLGEKFFDGTAKREGNADSCVFFQDAMVTADRQWVAISISRETDFNLLAHCAVIDGVTLKKWVLANTLQAVLTQLRKAGIAAEPISDGKAICAADWFAGSTSLRSDPNDAPVKGFPFQFRGAPMSITRATPSFGQDTASVLKEILGLTDGDIGDLTQQGVISDRPKEISA